MVKASKAHTDPNLNPKALASHGRLDVVARAAIASLSTRLGIRRNTTFYAVLEGPPRPPITIELRGSELEKLPLSERGLGELFKKLILGEREPGAVAYKLGFRELVANLVGYVGPAGIIYLHERGVDVKRVKHTSPIVAILGDHLGVDKRTESWIRSMGIPWVSIGPLSYFTEHCISYLHYILDTR